MPGSWPAGTGAPACGFGRDRGRRLLLCGHLDTVGLACTPDGLTPRVEGDRLYARGAYDMKAGLTAALIACRDEADIADLIERCRPADPRLTVTARTVLHRPPMETPPTAPIVQALVAAAGPGTSASPMSYWADSASLAAAGIPTVLHGPEGDGTHADTEWVSRTGTTTATTVLTQLAQDFCS